MTFKQECWLAAMLSLLAIVADMWVTSKAPPAVKNCHANIHGMCTHNYKLEF